MTNFECIMLGLEIVRVLYSDVEIDTAVDAMVTAGWVTAAEETKVKAVAKRVVLLRRNRRQFWCH